MLNCHIVLSCINRKYKVISGTDPAEKEEIVLFFVNDYTESFLVWPI